MKKAYEVLIQGDITQNEIDELVLELDNDDLVIDKLLTKSQTPQDFLNLVFNDFNAISFTRDFVLGGLLTASWKIISSVVEKLRKKNKAIKNVCYEIEIKIENEQSKFLIFVESPENFEMLIEKTEGQINLEFIQNIGDANQIYISLDSDNTLQIKKF